MPTLMLHLKALIFSCLGVLRYCCFWRYCTLLCLCSMSPLSSAQTMPRSLLRVISSGYGFFGMSMFSLLALSSTFFVSVGLAASATKDSKDPQKRKEIYREIAEHSAIESILLEALDKGLLLLVTLKSRKVYVGMVDEARLNLLDTSTLTLIPFMSGYRDKDTLTYRMEHNYAEHYLSQGITLTSEPLSVYQFRHVLPFDQIESFSLFNVPTYNLFQETIKNI